ncbi:DUF4102 domain-containing protein [Alteromonas sediminis]|uniref:DUF4102 domain-containing protein n=1 Tax=Alteromonas sediminis TaxID=2259342 RepID=A0A3N5ZDL0_9ALTE|nr:integrase family protein [Alteromonas sediminis]RPJ68228.1 DUF4102 domain-containing protein [Alteromonas sediminis]
MASANTSTKVNFTAGRVADFSCPEGKREAFLWDAKTQGLGLRAFASGKKTYIYQAWINGKTRRAVIGPSEVFDIGQARKEAEKLAVQASQNIPPAKVKREKAAAERAEERELLRGRVTLGEVWEEYVKANKSDWGDRHIEHHFKATQKPGLPLKRGKGVTKAGCLNSLISTKLADFNDRKIEQWLREESKTRPGVAAQTYRMLFACLNWASEQEQYIGLIKPDKLKTKAIKKRVPKLAPKSDVLQKEQLAGFFTYVRQISDPVVSAYLQTLLLTGARRNELTGLKWEDIDFTWSTLAIRDKATSKGQDAGLRVIPLTPYVASLLINLPRRNQWVFSSPRSASGRLQEPKKSFQQAKALAGIEITLHGLRRSFSTLSEWVEVPTGVVAQIMGHKPSATAEKHYKQRPIDLLRKWHSKLEGWILEQAGLVQPAVPVQRLNVVGGVHDV